MEPVVSLQAETGENGLTLEGLLSGGNEEDRVLERLALRGAMSLLPERERQVLLLRFYRGKELVLINKGETSADEIATLILREPIGQVLGL